MASNNSNSAIPSSGSDTGGGGAAAVNGLAYQHDHQQQEPMEDTRTMIEQRITENECAPFFVDLSTLPKSQLDHLMDTGLLVVSTVTDANKVLIAKGADINDFPYDAEDAVDAVDDTNVNIVSTSPNVNQDTEAVDKEVGGGGPQYRIALLRTAHEHYLSTVWRAPLHSSFVTLDSSRPWMIYWSVHALDLLRVTATGTSPRTEEEKYKFDENEVDHHDSCSRPNTLDDSTACRMVETLNRCFTFCDSDITLDETLVEEDPMLRRIRKGKDKSNTSSTEPTASKVCAFSHVGGFGGGYDQMAHAATSYAAIMALCILSNNKSFSSTTELVAPSMALQFLEEIRPLLYPWILSLWNTQDGSFRMHHDGEVDVRATYCCVAMLTLLNLWSDSTSSTTILGYRKRSAQYIATCQSYEGGFGGEPGTEAHGGYTYCAVAALYLLDGFSYIDISALCGWLSRRQTSFEGGFNGRTNKLVDGCYSFWQGGAVAIISQVVQSKDDERKDATDVTLKSSSDPWLQYAKTSKSTLLPPLLMDCGMLERYILLCCQDVNGGLRDKPSKPRDFYHTCYCLSGLSVSQNLGRNNPDHFQQITQDARTATTHPCYNVRIEHVQLILDRFADPSDNKR